MKKPIYLMILVMMFFMLGCEYQSTINQTTQTAITTTDLQTTMTEEETTEMTSEDTTVIDSLTTIAETTLTTEATVTTETTETTESSIDVVNEVFEQLNENIPSEISENHTLPTIEMDGLLIEYYFNDELLEDYEIIYQPQAYSELLSIYLLIIYNDASKSYEINILQERDEALYQQEVIEARFDDVFQQLTSAIPNRINSDLTLPEEEINGIQITYSVDQSMIDNQRLIFTFPMVDEVVQLSMTLTFNEEVRHLSLPITMTAYENLPRLPEIHITTDNEIPIESKEIYVYGRVNLYGFNEDNSQFILLSQTRMQIRLRGNSSLIMPKKSYKIKFIDKQYMFSDYKEKDWLLIANFADQTLVRNALAYQMANDLDMAFVPMVQFVNVYLNGVYQGNYLLTDQIEVTNDRVDIEENTPNIDTGYLIEFDKILYQTGLENSDENFFLIDGIPFVIKSPDIEDSHYSHNHYLYIESYMREVFDALKNQEDYTLWIDEASFIDWFIVNEVFKNVDSGYSSVYYYKDAGGLLKMGPVWDLDLSSGNYGHLQEDLRGPEGWYTSRYEKNILFFYLMEYDSFRQALKQRWNEVYEDVILNMIDSIYPTVDAMAKSRYDNFLQWDIIGTYEDWFISPEILELDTYHLQVEFLRNFLIVRVEWLNNQINQFD